MWPRCRDCGSDRHLLDARQGEMLCSVCGLVQGSVLDDRAPYGTTDINDRQYEDDHAPSGTFIGAPSGPSSWHCNRSEYEVSLKRTQAQMSRRSQSLPLPPTWHRDKKTQLINHVNKLTNGASAEWVAAAWAMFTVIVERSNIEEAKRDPVLAVSAYYASLMLPKRIASNADVQSEFGISDADFGASKRAVALILIQDVKYKTVVSLDTDNQETQMRTYIHEVLGRSTDVSRVVHLLAHSVDQMRLDMNALLGRPKFVIPAVISLSCRVLGVDVSLDAIMESCQLGPASKVTVQRNIVVLNDKVVQMWGRRADPDEAKAAWEAHVADVRARADAQKVARGGGLRRAMSSPAVAPRDRKRISAGGV